MKKQEIIREQSLPTLNEIIATYNKNGYVIMPGSLQLVTTTKTNFWIIIMEKDLDNLAPVQPINNSKGLYPFYNSAMAVTVMATYRISRSKIDAIRALRESTRVKDLNGETTSVMGLKEAKEIVEDVISTPRQDRYKKIKRNTI